MEENQNNPDHNSGFTTWYSTTKTMSVDHVNGCEDTIHVRAFIEFDVWLEWLSSCMNADGSRNVIVCLVKTDERFLLSEEYRPSQTGYNDCDHGRKGNPRNFMRETVEKKKSLQMCP